MNMKKLFTFLSCCVIAGIAAAQKTAAVTTKELKRITGCGEATLYYEGSMIRKPRTVQATVSIRRVGMSSKFAFAYRYSTQPGDTSNDTLSISKNGRKINNAAITSKQYLRNGTLQIITEAEGFDKDTNKAVTTRYTYILGKRSYHQKKEIRLPKQDEWTLREYFKYAGKPC